MFKNKNNFIDINLMGENFKTKTTCKIKKIKGPSIRVTPNTISLTAKNNYSNSAKILLPNMTTLNALVIRANCSNNTENTFTIMLNP